jgi:CheY-like chemotaxis protein
MITPLRILHLEDDANEAVLVQSTLENEGVPCAVTRVQSRAAYAAALELGGVGLILPDFSLPGFHGHAALEINPA